MKYLHSPKVFVIAGPPAAGKTTLAKRLHDECGYSLLSLDAINESIAKKLEIAVAELSEPHPAIVAMYDEAFLAAIRELRFVDFVLEGCRISHPHIFDAFSRSLFYAYGEYAILRCFYLAPKRETRIVHYRSRLAALDEAAAKPGGEWARPILEGERNKGFNEYLEPVLPGFTSLEFPAEVLEQAFSLRGSRHPSLPLRHAGLIQDIAESPTYNPFYQRVEVDDTVVIQGFTDSSASWENIGKFAVDFTGRTVCDVGCMHGYFSFKAEEAGACVTGVDIDPGAIGVAAMVAKARHSSCTFQVLDITRDRLGSFDILFALNMLHRVTHFQRACETIFQSAEAFILEVGESQLEGLMRTAKQHGLNLRKMIKSHRSSNVIGQRVLCHITQ